MLVTVTERSRRRVGDALDRLDEVFGVERVRENHWKVPPDEYERTRERFDAGTLGGAGAWVGRDDGAVLLVREADESGWSEPSGKHEVGETLAATARREVQEETALQVALKEVVLAQKAIHVDRTEPNGTNPDGTDPDRPPIYRLVVVFAAERVGGTARAREAGIEAVRWFRDHPDDLLYDALEDLPIPAHW